MYKRQGHTSVTIYKKVIRKVYDKDRGFEIIDALHETPSIAVPIVLKRLKQKDEEWRRAQREWNKVWRELEQKVYYKSLDHLGLTFKQADKKLLTTKQLVSEISTIKVDQANKRIHPLTPKPKSQLDYHFKDREVLYDILNLAKVFIDCNTTYSNPDKEKMFDFLKSFLVLFFSYPMYEVETAFARRRGDIGVQDGEENSGQENSDLSRKRTREEENLLKDVLRRNKYQKGRNFAEEEPIPEESEFAEKTVEEKEEEEIIRQEAKKPWLLGSIVDEANEHGFVENRKTFNMFANTNIYVFFRHLATLYTSCLLYTSRCV